MAGNAGWAKYAVFKDCFWADKPWNKSPNMQMPKNRIMDGEFTQSILEWHGSENDIKPQSKSLEFLYLRNMGNRRDFLRNAAALGAGIMLVPDWLAAAPQRKKTIAIIHTNDFHSRLDSFPDNHPKYPGMGGIAKLKTLMDAARAEHEHVLLLDSGDIFQGTPYFNVFEGVPEIAWMNRAGYHAGTLGNHDFDNGVEKLAEVLKHADFPLVNCNYSFTDTALQDKITRYNVVSIAGKKIGITGLGIQPKGLIPDHLCAGIVYKDPVQSVQKVADELRKIEKCDMVVVLSHLGYMYDNEQMDDRKLASLTHGIDLILGGHTHTFLEAPVTVKNSQGSTVTINQAGWAGLVLGKIVVEL